MGLLAIGIICAVGCISFMHTAATKAEMDADSERFVKGCEYIGYMFGITPTTTVADAHMWDGCTAASNMKLAWVGCIAKSNISLVRNENK